MPGSTIPEGSETKEVKGDLNNNQRLLYKTVLIPSIASLADRVILHPIDTITSVQQKQNLILRSAIKHIYGEFGLRGFYKGMSVLLFLSAAPGHIIFYGTYTGLKEKFAQKGYHDPIANALVSSVITGGVCLILITPVETKRLRDTFNIRVDNPPSKLKYYYRGFGPMAFKAFTQLPISLAGTDILKNKLHELGETSDNPTLRHVLNSRNSYTTFLSGFAMGAAGQLVTNPVDVIKTKMMTDYSYPPTSAWQHAKIAYQEGSLLKSLPTRIGRWGASTGLALGCINWLNSSLLENQDSNDFVNQVKRESLNIILIGASALAILVVISLVWRHFSHRQSIPCPAWLGWLVEMENPFAKNHRATVIIKNSGIEEKMTVLDAGCGPGRVTIPAAQKVGSEGQVIAMDIQEAMLKRVKEKARTIPLTNIKFLHAGLGEEKLEHNKFDRALMVAVLGEIPNPQAAMNELFRALKPSGILSVSETIFDPHYQRRATVLHLARTAGFQKQEQFGNFIAYTLNLKKSSSELNNSSHKPIPYTPAPIGHQFKMPITSNFPMKKMFFHVSSQVGVIRNYKTIASLPLRTRFGATLIGLGTFGIYAATALIRKPTPKLMLNLSTPPTRIHFTH